MAKLQSIGVFPEKKAPKVLADSAQLIAGGGLAGDFHANDAERAISLIDAQTLALMAREDIKGLCTSKFATNLVTEGLDVVSLQPGDVLRIGAAVVTVTQVGKECFAACGMEDRTRCPLRSACAFGVAARDGAIAVGDELVIEQGR